MKHSLVLCAMLMMMAAASLLASPAAARDPFVGLSVEEGPERPAGAGDDLDCCNDCRCDRSWGWCTCKDVNSYEIGCNPGCEDCRCTLWPTMTCVCGDMIKRCPDRCGTRRSSPAPDHGDTPASDPALPANAAA